MYTELAFNGELTLSNRLYLIIYKLIVVSINVLEILKRLHQNIHAYYGLNINFVFKHYHVYVLYRLVILMHASEL